jgi:hypothetical protein
MLHTIKHGTWSYEEDEQLWQLAEAGKTRREAGKQIGRSKNSVAWRAKTLRIPFRRQPEWSEHEDEQLRIGAAQDKPAWEIAQTLKRSKGAVRQRASRLKIKLPHADGTPEAKRALAIRLRARKRKPQHNAWTAEHDALLAKLIAKNYKAASCAQHLHRSVRGTEQRAHLLGLRFSNVGVRRPSPWNDQVDKFAAEKWLGGMSGGKLAKTLGPDFTRASVIGRMRRIGAKREQAPANQKTAGLRRHRARVKKERKPFVLKDIRYQGTGFVPLSPKPHKPPKTAEECRAQIKRDELKSHHCRWIDGDPQTIGVGEPLFCGEPREGGLAYCAAHARRAFNLVSLAPRQCFPGDEITS